MSAHTDRERAAVALSLADHDEVVDRALSRSLKVNLTNPVLVTECRRRRSQQQSGKEERSVTVFEGGAAATGRVRMPREQQPAFCGLR